MMENNFSFWYPKIEGKCSALRVPESLIFKVPEYLWKYFYLDDPEESKKEINAWLQEEVIPVIKEKIKTPFFFVKNGTFSNKFSNSCFSYDTTLLNNLMDINYAAVILGAGGISELVIREYIQSDDSRTAKIYGGLPLRSEIRIFYDFDERKVLYSENYWNPDYVEKSLYSKTDRIIFAHEKDYICSEYLRYKDDVEAAVAKDMAEVSLTGRWSIDIMYDEIQECFWLIDMAKAEDSAYWDPGKVNYPRP